MASDKSRSKRPNPTGVPQPKVGSRAESKAKRGAPSTAWRSRESNFFRELYGFCVIGLLGVGVALALVPARARKYRELLELEASLEARQAELDDAGHKLTAAIQSMKTDPVYREAVYRKVLGVKRHDEEFLSPTPDAAH